MSKKEPKILIIEPPHIEHIHMLKNAAHVPSIEIITPHVGLVGGEPYPWLKEDIPTKLTEDDIKEVINSLFKELNAD